MICNSLVAMNVIWQFSINKLLYFLSIILVFFFIS